MRSELSPNRVPRSVPSVEATEEERRLNDLAHDIVEHLFDLAPQDAVQLGLHSYDGILPDLSPEATDRWIRKAVEFEKNLESIPPSRLSRDCRLDHFELRLGLERALFYLRDWPKWDLQPLAYAFLLQLSEYISREYASATVRADVVVRHLLAIPSFLRVGTGRLKDPLPEPYVRAGLEAFDALPDHLREAADFARSVAPDRSREVEQARGEADAAVREFRERLGKSLERATTAFALGPDRFQKLLWVSEGIATPWPELLREGWADLRANRSRLEEITRNLIPSMSADRALARLREDHPTAEGLLDEARRCVTELREFLVAQGFVSVPEGVTCAVEESPPADRPFSFASMRSAGPFEASTIPAAYRITPVEPTWAPERQTEWLERFNRAALGIVTAHEVYPGHFLQFVRFNQIANTLAQKALGSGAFFEGWAHYAEQLVIEQGFRREAPWAHVAQLQEALLRDCRLIASITMHAQGTSLEEATDLFVREARLPRFPAEREARRGTFGPTYFGYTLGKLAILSARSAFLRRHPDVGLWEFHDRLLSLPAPPVGLIDALLEGEDAMAASSEGT
jgi:hypothetical protein